MERIYLSSMLQVTSWVSAVRVVAEDNPATGKGSKIHLMPHSFELNQSAPPLRRT